MARRACSSLRTAMREIEQYCLDTFRRSLAATPYVPPKPIRPSLARAIRCVISFASSVLTGTISSTRLGSRSGGM
jgi:hypothetical protein